MKTKKESNSIDLALHAIETAYSCAGYSLFLKYSNDTETVLIRNGNQAVTCNVNMDSVANVIFDVVTTIQKEVVL